MFGWSRREKVEKAQKQLAVAVEARNHEEARLAVERLVALCGFEPVALRGFLALSTLTEPGHPVGAEQACVVSLVAALTRNLEVAADADRCLAHHFPDLSETQRTVRGLIGGLAAEDLVIKVGEEGHKVIAEKALALMTADGVASLDAVRMGHELARALLKRESVGLAASTLFALEGRIRAAVAAGDVDADLGLQLVSVHSDVCRESGMVTLVGRDAASLRAAAEGAKLALDEAERLRLFSVAMSIYDAVLSHHPTYGTAVLQFASYLADAGDLVGAEQQGRRALPLIAAGGDTHMLARAELKLAHILGDTPEALALAHSALQNAESSAHPDAASTIVRCERLIAERAQSGQVFIRPS